jgi:hypothetical protein
MPIKKSYWPLAENIGTLNLRLCVFARYLVRCRQRAYTEPGQQPKRKLMPPSDKKCVDNRNVVFKVCVKVQPCELR